MACLYLGNKTGKHLADVFLVFRTHGGRQCIGGTIPRYYSVLLMREHTYCLPAIGQQDIACQNLFCTETIVSMNSFVGVN